MADDYGSQLETREAMESKIVIIDDKLSKLMDVCFVTSAILKYFGCWTAE